MSDRGPLTHIVLAYTQTMEGIVPTVKSAQDWAPLAELVAVDRFERVGTLMEVHDWPHYTEMLTGWASSIEKFETTVRRISELRDLVYFEVEERHFRKGRMGVVNSMTVFAFDEQRKIRSLAVYLQQPRSRS